MSQITYKKMSLFDAPENSIICHAVNAQGVWGRGIAKEFKKRYQHSYECYHGWCRDNKVIGTASKSTWSIKEPHWVWWICTSEGFKEETDPKEVIKINTTLALDNMCKQLYYAHPREDYPIIDVYSNKFNSGLFNVPWEESELILKTVLKRHLRIQWIVCDPDLKE
jgi:hypothetical protein